jgi:hypothetical protein
MKIVINGLPRSGRAVPKFTDGLEQTGGNNNGY